LKPLEVGRVDHHREVVQVLEAWTSAQRFSWLHGKEVDHGVLADPHGGKSDLAPAEFFQPLGFEAQDVRVEDQRAAEVGGVEHAVVHGVDLEHVVGPSLVLPHAAWPDYLGVPFPAPPSVRCAHPMMTCSRVMMNGGSAVMKWGSSARTCAYSEVRADRRMA